MQPLHRSLREVCTNRGLRLAGFVNILDLFTSPYRSAGAGVTVVMRVTVEVLDAEVAAIPGVSVGTESLGLGKMDEVVVQVDGEGVGRAEQW